MILLFIRRYWYWLAIAAVIAGTLLLVRCVDRSMDSAIDTSHNAGRAEQRADDMKETVSRIERANNAAETISRDPDAKRALCVRHARNPDDC